MENSVKKNGFDFDERVNYVIYGAGVYARRVLDGLRHYNKSVIGFIVSQVDNTTPKSIDGIPVYPVDGIPDGFRSSCILIAVNESLHKDIRLIIENKLPYINIEDIYFLSEAEVCALYRDSHRVNTWDFLRKTSPVSNGWGFDRGTPVDRYYIERFLNEECKKYQDVQITLEVGEDVYSRRFFPNSEHEILDFSRGMDLTDEGSIPANRYDMFICTQTFHQIYDVKKAIKGSWDLLKDGGIMLATVCGTVTKLARCEEYEHFWGFTPASISMLMREVYGENVSVEHYGNAMAATAFIQGLAAEELDKELLDEKDMYFTICLSIVARKVVG